MCFWCLVSSPSITVCAFIKDLSMSLLGHCSIITVEHSGSLQKTCFGWTLLSFMVPTCWERSSGAEFLLSLNYRPDSRQKKARVFSDRFVTFPGIMSLICSSSSEISLDWPLLYLSDLHYIYKNYWLRSGPRIRIPDPSGPLFKSQAKLPLSYHSYTVDPHIEGDCFYNTQMVNTRVLHA